MKMKLNRTFTVAGVTTLVASLLISCSTGSRVPKAVGQDEDGNYRTLASTKPNKKPKPVPPASSNPSTPVTPDAPIAPAPVVDEPVASDPSVLEEDLPP